MSNSLNLRKTVAYTSYAKDGDNKIVNMLSFFYNSFCVCLRYMQTATSLSVEGIVHIMLYCEEALKLAVVCWT